MSDNQKQVSTQSGTSGVVLIIFELLIWIWLWVWTM
ncbi:hypothetical protein CRE_24821 [Caenorhabditis remanei]|uniref:Uncharacterized protein n=1 Tax=Caenorhabditis remanei TaxID=31234 RepID=E3NHP2_CAERE|nr:hypothetical protein CRE_24821 [Caenorhabditis remanei]